ncbi:MAG: hypothetical protein ACJ8MR_12225 [Povalibacter sp.]
MKTAKADAQASMTKRAALAAAWVTLFMLAGCGPVKLVATTNIPPPLVAKIPVSVALFVPKEFSSFAHDEERSGTDWHVELGNAQTDGLTRLLNAMFEHVVVVDSLNGGSSAGAEIRAILEPSVEEYAFVTPRDAGSPFYAVSIKYRMNVYTPDGRLADSWAFTGYGTAPSAGISSDQPLTQATALALRDAGAKLAVEFRDQAIVRGLLPESAANELAVAPLGPPPAAPALAPGSSVTSTPAGTPAPESGAAPESVETPATAPAPAETQPSVTPAESQPSQTPSTEVKPADPSKPQSLALK